MYYECQVLYQKQIEKELKLKSHNIKIIPIKILN